MPKPKKNKVSEMATNGHENDLPYPETGLSPALQRAIKAKIDRGELDEIDHDVFEKNLRKVIKNKD